jgi:hypothetical protein
MIEMNMLGLQTHMIDCSNDFTAVAGATCEPLARFNNKTKKSRGKHK